MTSNVSFHEGLLTVQGVICDTIASFSTCHPEECDRAYPFNSENISSISSAYGSFTTTQEALWRTIVARSTREGFASPGSYSWLLEPKIWGEGVAGVYTNGLGLNEFMTRNQSLVLSGYTLETLVRRRKRFLMRSDRVYNPTEEQESAISWAMNVLTWRRLVGTYSGRMGLAPCFSQVGDRIAILVGSSMPIDLRKRGASWAVIGECYLHGVMNGEILRTVEENKLHTEPLVIC